MFPKKIDFFVMKTKRKSYLYDIHTYRSLLVKVYFDMSHRILNKVDSNSF